MTGTFLHRTMGLMVVTGIGFLSFLGTGLAQEQSCTVPTHFYATEPPLPKTAAALTNGQTVFIVALGGASTLGQAAGGSALAWPARLAVALTRRFPGVRVQVDNRAVARQTAQEMAARLDREVLAVRPTLVIWETGTTDAVDSTDVDAFRQTLQAGIDRLHAAGVEVMVMDMQFAPPTHAVINFDRYESVLREVTDANEVPLFRRHDLMHYWAENDVLDLRAAGEDTLHTVASRLYDCIGRAVAELVARGVQPQVRLPATDTGSRQ